MLKGVRTSRVKGRACDSDGDGPLTVRAVLKGVRVLSTVSCQLSRHLKMDDSNDEVSQKLLKYFSQVILSVSFGSTR